MPSCSFHTHTQRNAHPLECIAKNRFDRSYSTFWILFNVPMTWCQLILEAKALAEGAIQWSAIPSTTKSCFSPLKLWSNMVAHVAESASSLIPLPSPLVKSAQPALYLLSEEKEEKRKRKRKRKEKRRVGLAHVKKSKNTKKIRYDNVDTIERTWLERALVGMGGQEGDSGKVCVLPFHAPNNVLCLKCLLDPHGKLL